jgi:hypothetical protein
MKINWPAFVVGMSVIVGLSFVMGLINAAAGQPAGMETWLAPMTLGAVVYAIASALSNNRSVRGASDAERQAALAFAPPPGRALLYVHRQGFVGKAVGIDINLDGRTVAQVKSPRFTTVVIVPGQHRLEAMIVMKVGGKGMTDPGAAQFTAEPGDVLVFRATMKMGALRNRIELVAEPLEAARPLLARTRMVAPDVAEV